ncbi:hypothetical protein FHS26_003146 [Rhizobium pisi]|jgi:hypothetical protein|uniref:Uncharacterized protein n=1 Tax=Rhizobium pisi TaxID=574561 RepID=A0A7W5BM14_9HYPH|nr:hypothetical protein [Rhizobium pisi]MBB3135401.1 hypothetical protein [Rhizobium pisi]
MFSVNDGHLAALTSFRQRLKLEQLNQFGGRHYPVLSGAIWA